MVWRLVRRRVSRRLSRLQTMCNVLTYHIHFKRFVCPRQRISGHLILLLEALLVFNSTWGSIHTSTTESSTHSSKPSLHTSGRVFPATATNSTNNTNIFSTSSTGNVTIDTSHKSTEDLTTTSTSNVFVPSQETKETTITPDRYNTENTVSVTRSTNNQRQIHSTVVTKLPTFTSGLEKNTATAETGSSPDHHSSLASFQFTEETTITPDSFNANTRKSTLKNTTPVKTKLHVSTESSLNTVQMSNRISSETVTDDLSTENPSHLTITDTLISSPKPKLMTPSSQFHRSPHEFSELRSTTITTEPPVTDDGHGEHSTAHRESRVTQFSFETASNLPSTTTLEATDALISKTDWQSKETPTQYNMHETTITSGPSVFISSSTNTQIPSESKETETVDHNTITREAYTISSTASTVVPTSEEPLTTFLSSQSTTSDSTTHDASNENSTTTDHSEVTPVTSNYLATDTEVQLTSNQISSTIDNSELTTVTSTYTTTGTNAQHTSGDISTTIDHSEITSVTPSATDKAVDSTTVLLGVLIESHTESSTPEESVTGTSTEIHNSQTSNLIIKHASTTDSPSTHVSSDTAYTSRSVSLTTSADTFSGSTQESLYSLTTSPDTTGSISSEASSGSITLQTTAISQGGGLSTQIKNYTTDNIEITPTSVTNGASRSTTYISQPSATDTNSESTHHTTVSPSNGTSTFQIPFTENVSETLNASVTIPVSIPLTQSSSDSPPSTIASTVSTAVNSSIINYQTMQVLSTGTTYNDHTNSHSSTERKSLPNESTNPFTITKIYTNDITTQSIESSKYSNLSTETLAATDTPSQPSTNDVISIESTQSVLSSNTIETTVTPSMLKHTSEPVTSGLTESKQSATPKTITTTSRTSSTDAATFEYRSSTSTNLKASSFTGSSSTTVSNTSFTPSAPGSVSTVTTEPTTVTGSFASSDIPSATTLVKSSSSSDKSQPMTETISFSGTSTKAAGIVSVTNKSTTTETHPKLTTVTDILVSITDTTLTDTTEASNQTLSSNVAGSDSSTTASESTASSTPKIKTTETAPRITTVTDIPSFTEEFTTDNYFIPQTTDLSNISSTISSNEYSTKDKRTEGMETQTTDAGTTVTLPSLLQETNRTSHSTKDIPNKGEQTTVTYIPDTLSSKPVDAKYSTDMTTITNGPTVDLLSGTPTAGTEFSKLTSVFRLNESHTSPPTSSEITQLSNSYPEPSIAFSKSYFSTTPSKLLNNTTASHDATTITEVPSMTDSTLSTYIKHTNDTASTAPQTIVTTNYIDSSQATETISSTVTPTTLQTATSRNENFTVTPDQTSSQTTDSVSITNTQSTLHMPTTSKGNYTHAYENETHVSTTVAATPTNNAVTSATQTSNGSTTSKAVTSETTSEYISSLSTSDTNGLPTSISSETGRTASKISPNTGTSSKTSSFTKHSTTNFHISSFTETPNTVEKSSVSTNTAANVGFSSGKTPSVSQSLLRTSNTPTETVKANNGTASTTQSSHKVTSSTKASVITKQTSTSPPNTNTSVTTTLMSTSPSTTNASRTTKPMSTSPSITNASFTTKSTSTSPPNTNASVITKPMSTSPPNTNASVTIKPMSTSPPNTNTSLTTKPMSTSPPNTNASLTIKPKSTSSPKTNTSVTTEPKSTFSPTTNASVTIEQKSTSSPNTNTSVTTEPNSTSLPNTNASVTTAPKSTPSPNLTIFTTSTTTTTLASTLPTLVTMYPIVQPNPATAVYVFHFTMVIQGKFNENMNTNDSFKQSVETMLLTYVFEDVPGSSVDISFREDSSGSTVCEIKSDVPMSGLLKKNETAADYLKISAMKVHTNKGKLSTPAGSVNAEVLEGELADEAEIDQCENITNSCDVFRDHVCPRGVPSGTCILKCDKDIGRCGQHGQCFFDALTNATACRCEQTSYTIYHGDRCSQSTRTMTFFLAMSLGIGGAILLVLVTIIVCMCFRMRRNDKSRNHSIYDTSDWEVPANDVTLKDLSFRGSTRAEPFSGNYYRAYAFNDEPYQPVFGGGERRLFFPESGRGSTSTAKFDVIDDTTVPSYSTIDVTADYSIRRPRITSRPYCDFSQQHTEKQDEHTTEDKKSQAVGIKTTL